MNTNVYPLPTLADHLTDCEQRYQTLLDRFDQVDIRFNRIESGLQDIKEMINNSRYKTLTHES